MRKTTIATLAVALVSGGIAVGMAGGIASAHHPEITVDTDCGDNGWTATYTVQSDAVRGLTWSVNGHPAKPDSEPFVFVENFDFSVLTDVFDATATWSNGAGPETRSAAAGRPSGCQPTTSSTTSSTTTTTTIPVDPCSWPAVKTNDEVCVSFNIEVECGSISGTATHSVSNQPSWIYGVWFSTDLPTGPADGTPGGLGFAEDSGDVNVFYWVAGTENDVVRGVPTWDNPGQQSIDTDCEQPEPPDTTEAPTTTTEPPVTTAPPTTVTPTPSTDPAPTTTTVVGSVPAGGTPPPAPAPAPNMPEWMLSEASLPQTR